MDTTTIQQPVVNGELTRLIRHLHVRGVFGQESTSNGNHEKVFNPHPSPYSVNLHTVLPNQKGPLTQGDVGEITRMLHNMVLELRLPYQYVLGVPTAGEPFAQLLSAMGGRHFLELEKKENVDDGYLPQLQGKFRKQKTVLLVADTLTDFSCLLTAITVCKRAELWVRDIVVVVDTLHGDSQSLIHQAYRVHPLLTIEQILAVLSLKT